MQHHDQGPQRLPTGLTDLPNESILSIIEHLCRHCAGKSISEPSLKPTLDHAALVNLSKTCARFYWLAGAHVYHDVSLGYNFSSFPDTSTKHENYSVVTQLSDLIQGFLFFDQKPNLEDPPNMLAESVKHLEVNLGRIQRKHPSAFDGCWIPNFLNQLPNLEHLEFTMELPLWKTQKLCSSLGAQEDNAYKSVKTLSLKRRVDHLSEFKEYGFSFDELRHLHSLYKCFPAISTLNFFGVRAGHDHSFHAMVKYKFSNLTTLRLVNCVIAGDTLKGLVESCSGLETFIFSRGEYPEFQIPTDYATFPGLLLCSHITPREVIEILEESAAETLKHLELMPFYHGMWNAIDYAEYSGMDEHLNYTFNTAVITTLCGFQKLETVKLDQDSLIGPIIHNYIIDDLDPEPPLGSAIEDNGFRLMDVLPKTVKSLHITNSSECLEDSIVYFVDNVCAGRFPDLKHVHLHGQLYLRDVCLRNSMQVYSPLESDRDWPVLSKATLACVEGFLSCSGVKVTLDAMEPSQFEWAEAKPPAQHVTVMMTAGIMLRMPYEVAAAMGNLQLYSRG
ncbi:hypothetical protein C8034_v008182 [Colletotrichum sidae]|uniref:F-box domain-containing protein n=1 Tax=Colletotrichum sidae TaxID=1347389 RepID=A0A4R8TPE5_9PEZI|nr:hypothetical protein C8034_v008182 [Colletotrichum sidae]